MKCLIHIVHKTNCLFWAYFYMLIIYQCDRQLSSWQFDSIDIIKARHALCGENFVWYKQWMDVHWNPIHTKTPLFIKCQYLLPRININCYTICKFNFKCSDGYKASDENKTGANCKNVIENFKWTYSVWI